MYDTPFHCLARKAVSAGTAVILLLLPSLLAGELPDRKPDILGTAHELAKTTYADYRYGSNMTRKQIDCTQFLQKILEKVLQRNLGREEAEAVNIAGLASTSARLDLFVEKGDARTKGVVYALTEITPLGEEIPPERARPGDMIQYWIKSSSAGHYRGHAAIIESTYVKNGTPVATLFGSHRTLGRIGIAVEKSGRQLELNLTGPNRKIYVVRLNKIR